MIMDKDIIEFKYEDIEARIQNTLPELYRPSSDLPIMHAWEKYMRKSTDTNKQYDEVLKYLLDQNIDNNIPNIVTTQKSSNIKHNEHLKEKHELIYTNFVDLKYNISKAVLMIRFLLPKHFATLQEKDILKAHFELIKDSFKIAVQKLNTTKDIINIEKIFSTVDCMMQLYSYNLWEQYSQNTQIYYTKNKHLRQNNNVFPVIKSVMIHFVRASQKIMNIINNVMQTNEIESIKDTNILQYTIDHIFKHLDETLRIKRGKSKNIQYEIPNKITKYINIENKKTLIVSFINKFINQFTFLTDKVIQNIKTYGPKSIWRYINNIFGNSTTNLSIDCNIIKADCSISQQTKKSLYNQKEGKQNINIEPKQTRYLRDPITGKIKKITIGKVYYINKTKFCENNDKINRLKEGHIISKLLVNDDPKQNENLTRYNKIPIEKTTFKDRIEWFKNKLPDMLYDQCPKEQVILLNDTSLNTIIRNNNKVISKENSLKKYLNQNKDTIEEIMINIIINNIGVFLNKFYDIVCNDNTKNKVSNTLEELQDAYITNAYINDLFIYKEIYPKMIAQTVLKGSDEFFKKYSNNDSSDENKKYINQIIDDSQEIIVAILDGLGALYTLHTGITILTDDNGNNPKYIKWTPHTIQKIKDIFLKKNQNNNLVNDLYNSQDAIPYKTFQEYKGDASKLFFPLQDIQNLTQEIYKAWKKKELYYLNAILKNGRLKIKNNKNHKTSATVNVGIGGVSIETAINTNNIYENNTQKANNIINNIEITKDTILAIQGQDEKRNTIIQFCKIEEVKDILSPDTINKIDQILDNDHYNENEDITSQSNYTLLTGTEWREIKEIFGENIKEKSSTPTRQLSETECSNSGVSRSTSLPNISATV